MKTATRFKTATARILTTLALVCLGALPGARAVVPPPDGGYPGGNTAEGQNALLSLTTGGFNTAIGWLSLRSNTTGSFNTAIGGGALFANTADQNTATGAGALLFNSTGIGNTANGAFALFFNTIGNSNTANGLSALQSNISGGFNTATGSFALTSNTTGSDNTAYGAGALESNTGSQNTAIGSAALLFNSTANGNTATGFQALINNTDADGNTAYGYQALSSNTGPTLTASFNTAIGYRALANQTSGVNNIALGVTAGDQITTGDSNIDIGNFGQFSDSRTIRIGEDQTRTFITAIAGVNEGGNGILPVYINNLGQLGTQPPPSSCRFKKDIKSMEKTSEAILRLKPVNFHYESDSTCTPQFGLIAEEVAGVNPDLVLRDDKGEIYTVRYDAVNAMLLNEFLKEHRRVEEQGATITELKTEIANLTTTIKKQAAQIQKVSAYIEMTKVGSGVLANNH